MSLTPTQLQELQTIVLDLGEEFPHNADALWNAAIRIQTGGLGPTSGAGGQPAFDAAVADIKVCQEAVQTYQQRQGSPNSGFDVAVLQVVPATSTFPTGNVGEILYLETAPNSYVATDQIVIDPVGPNSVQMDEVGTTVFRTVPAASGGVEINNLSTGAGFERVLTTADLGGGVASVTGGVNINLTGTGVDPVVNLDAAITGVSVNGVTLSAAGAATNYLDESGAYSVPVGTIPPVDTVFTRTGDVVALVGDYSAFYGAIADVSANTAKVTNANHSGQVQGATALALDITAVTAQPASGAIIAADTIIINDGGVLSEATFAQMITFFDAQLTFGQVDSVVGGTNVSVNAGDPVNPIVNLDAAITGVSVNGVTLSNAGAATDFLNEAGAYSTPATPALAAVTAVGNTTPTDIQIITGAALTIFDAADVDNVSIEINSTTMAPAEALAFIATVNVEVYSFDEGINIDGGDIHTGGATSGLAFYRYGDSVSSSLRNSTAGITLQVVGTGDVFRIQSPSIELSETDDAETASAGFGQIWIQDDVAQRLMWTDDANNDHVIAISGGTFNENVSVNQSFNFNTSENRADNWIGHYFDGGNNTITLEDSGSEVNWPLYTTINIIAPGSGVQTVVEGSGTTLFDDQGNDTVGGVVISQGVVSITRQNATNYIIWGSGWS